MNWYTRLWMWFLSPMLDALNVLMGAHAQHLARIQENHAIAMAQISKLQRSIATLPNYSDTLDGIHNLAQQTKEIAKNARVQLPRLSIGMLMAWDAISYASEKYAKDLELHGQTSRNTEVLMWARAYLHENQWPIPEQDELLLLLTLRDQINKTRLVDKFG